MFCLDYALSFVCYSTLSSFAAKCGADASTLAFTVPAGALAGLFSAGALYPFDFVRQGSVGPNASSFAWSSVPFTAVYLGAYFAHRDPDSASSRITWALASASAASAAELPFDHAKRAMWGSGGRAAVMAAARVPLAALLLVAYDGVLTGQPAPNKASN